jgi:hypothetical protein
MKECNSDHDKLLRSLVSKPDVSKFLIIENSGKIKQSLAQKRIEKQQLKSLQYSIDNNKFTRNIESSVSETSLANLKQSITKKRNE